MDKIQGRHEFKFGYEGRMHRISFLQVGYPEGNFSYSQTGTSQTPSGSSGGDALASLMVGFPQGGSGYGVDVAVTTQNFAHAWYFQDNWRPTKRLTVNLGVRWEYLPLSHRPDRGIEFYNPDNNTQLICGYASVPSDCGVHISPLGFSPWGVYTPFIPGSWKGTGVP